MPDIAELSASELEAITQALYLDLPGSDVCPVCGQPIADHRDEFGKATALCKTPKFKRCVEHVMGQGKGEGSAYAICYSALENGSKSAAGILPEHEQEVAAVGGMVKALGDGRIGGYLVRFGSEAEPDLEGDFFTKETDFGPHTTSLVFYHHGLDGKMQRRVLDDGAKLHKDDVGVWVEAQLKMRDRYEKAIYSLAQAGKLGWSSGTANHLVEREPVGNAMRIVRWPLGLDASLTPMPAEPRGTQVTPIKAIESVGDLLTLVGESDQVKEPRGIKSEAGHGRKPAGGTAVLKRFVKSVGGKAMNLIEVIKKLVPGLSDEQYGQIESVLSLAGLAGGATEPGGDEAGEGEMMAGQLPSKAVDQKALEAALAAALKSLGIGEQPAPQAGQQQQPPAPQAAGTKTSRPPYNFKPAGSEPADDGQDGVKAVATLRFGETPVAIKAIARDLYGENYEVKRHVQHLAFGKFLRYGERALGAEDHQSLKMIILTPDQIKTMALSGADVAAFKTDMAETIDRLGGFTVPEDMRLDMIERLPGMTVVRSRADVMPTSSDVMSRITVTGGDDRHVGAIRVTWVGDTPATNQAVTNPTFGVEKTPVHIAMATVRVPRALLEDTAVPLTQKISEWVSVEYAIDEDEQFLVGNGIAKPQGILPGSTNALSITQVTSGAGATWPDANVVTRLMQLKYAVARQYRERCVWIMNDTIASTISQVLDGVGRPIWYNSLREGEPDRLLGYPALTSEAMPDIAANAYPLIFGDLSGYQIADRVGMTLTRDELTESEADIVKFVFRRRLGGQVNQTYRFAVLKIAA